LYRYVDMTAECSSVLLRVHTNPVFEVIANPFDVETLVKILYRF